MRQTEKTHPATALLRILVSAILLLMAVAFMWYGIFSYHVGIRNLAFVFQHQSSDWFPRVWLWKGNKSYFVDLDTEQAKNDYKEAIRREVILVDAWLALARTELADGNEQPARRIFDMLVPATAPTTTWKWQELLLAYDLRDERHFDEIFNFILEKMPARRHDAALLAHRFHGDWQRALEQVNRKNLATWLMQLMRMGKVDDSWDAWERMEKEQVIAGPDLLLGYCNFLIGRKQIPEAQKVWAAYFGPQPGPIANGGFEKKPVNSGFGWRIQKNREVDVRRSSATSYEGAFSLHLHFRGTTNVNFYHVSQLVPVQPGHRYQLVFAHKSRSLTTNEGVFIEVSGFACKGLRLQSNPVTGTERWRQESMEVAVPDTCRAVRIRLRRKQSLMFDNKISGDYWLDDVQLISRPDNQ